MKVHVLQHGPFEGIGSIAALLSARKGEPSLPAFVFPNVLNFLVENFNIPPISTSYQDLKAIFG